MEYKNKSARLRMFYKRRRNEYISNSGTVHREKVQFVSVSGRNSYYF